MIYDYDILEHIGNTFLQKLSCVLHTFDDVVDGAYILLFHATFLWNQISLMPVMVVISSPY